MNNRVISRQIESTFRGTRNNGNSQLLPFIHSVSSTIIYVKN